MNKKTASPAQNTEPEIEDLLERESGNTKLAFPYAKIFALIALFWSLFQLWIASPLPFKTGIGLVGGVEARGLHLTFALLLGFLAFGARPKSGVRRPALPDLVLGLAGAFCAAYLWFNHTDIAQRAGIMSQWQIGGLTLPIEAILGWIGIAILLEATRRIIGLPLVIMCLVFITYSLFGPSMPDLIAHKGVSITRLAGNL